MARVFLTVLLLLSFGSGAQTPGLESRAPLRAYLDGAMPTTDATAPPATLSSTNAFTNLATLAPHSGLVPYGVNQAFWSDGAIKTRWIGLPYEGPSGTNATIGFTPGEWTFPAGTVFVKHFELVTNQQTGARRRLETRLLVRDANGSVYGSSYRWRGDGSDADRVTSAQTESIAVTRADGSVATQTYLYPSPSQCLQCHVSAAGRVLGVKTRQQNGDFTYAATGRTDNQLRTWSHLGMFDQPLDLAAIAGYLKLANSADTTATLENRMRSYVDANCSNCHRPGGPGRDWDARYDISLAQTNIPGDAVLHSGAVLQRHNLAGSRLFIRDASTSAPMPPLGRNVLDGAYLDLMGDWAEYPFDAISVQPRSNTSVRVVFDRPVQAASATTAGNYALDGLTISSATLADPRTVLLSTSAMTPGATHRLRINGVKEAQAPGNPVWRDSGRTFVNSRLERTDLNGDARSDLLWRNSDGSTASWTLSGTTVTATSLYFGPGSGWQFGPPGDFDGDGRSDLLWRHTDGNLAMWLMDGVSPKGTALLFGPGNAWQVTHAADFDGDGKTDALLSHPDGSLAIWLFEGISIKAAALIAGPGDDVGALHVADFNADGKGDLVLRHGDGRLALWLMDGTAVASRATYFGAGNAWTVAATGDFDGDGKHDLVLANPDGSTALWRMDSTAVVETALLFGPGSGWRVTRTGDFDADARSDLVWQHTDGSSALWRMNGTAVVGTALLFGPGSGWSVSRLEDFNGDGRSDLVWRNTDGSTALWLMNGLAVSGTALLFGPGASWQPR